MRRTNKPHRPASHRKRHARSHSGIDYRTLPDEAWLRPKDIHRPNGPLPFSHTKFWSMVRNGELPPGTKIGKARCWHWRTIKRYLELLDDNADTQR